ncbi:MAG TPA: LysE family translocator [Stellaceae bacterium]|nr:LysE family translocator [Stellaceae bacterium]
MLPEPSVLAAFVVASLILIVTPGPDFFYVTARCLQQGRGAGFVASLGIMNGLFFHLAAASLGLYGILIYVPIAYDVIRYVGAAYLLYMAWQTLAARDKNASAATPSAAAGPARVYGQALLTNLLNPKVALFFLAFLPQFTRIDGSPVALQMAALGGLFIAMGFVYLMLLVAMVGTIAARLGRIGAFRRIQSWIAASTLAALAVWLVIPERR